MSAPASANASRGFGARLASRLSVLLRPEVSLFVVVWLTCGALTNQREMADYDLHAASVEAVAEYGTFELGHSTNKRLKRAGGYDSFRFRKDKTQRNKYRYSARQPGLAVAGAAPYVALRKLGFSLETHYDLCMAVIAWMTSGLFTAIGATLLCSLMQSWGTSRRTAVFLALGYALGTNLLPFSGVPHHDVQAAALIVAGLWSFDRARRRGSAGWAAATGLLFGLVLFFSLLPTVLVGVLLLSIVTSLPIRHGAMVALGFLAGLAPTLAYNWHYFGDPLMTMNRAGKYQDTYFSLSWTRTLRQLDNYLGAGWISVRLYEPQVYLGLLGLLCLRGRPWQDRVFLPLGAVAFIFFLCNLPTNGHSQFGPRYLMPLLPLAILGLSALFRLEGAWWWRTPLRTIAVLTVLYAMAVNIAGGFGYCCYADVNVFAPFFFWAHADRILADGFPLAWICAGLGLMWVALLAVLRLLTPRSTGRMA